MDSFYPIVTIVFCFLIVKNLKRVRARVQPLSETNNASPNVLSKRDMTLIKLASAEVVAGILLTSLYPINSLYAKVTSNISNKSPDRIAIESFMPFLGLLVLFNLIILLLSTYTSLYPNFFVNK